MDGMDRIAGVLEQVFLLGDGQRRGALVNGKGKEGERREQAEGEIEGGGPWESEIFMERFKKEGIFFRSDGYQTANQPSKQSCNLSISQSTRQHFFKSSLRLFVCSHRRNLARVVVSFSFSLSLTVGRLPTITVSMVFSSFFFRNWV